MFPHRPQDSSSCFRTPGLPQYPWMDSSRVRALIVWEPEAAGETELWSEIAGYSIREAPGSRMSQSGRTEGLDFPALQMQDVTFPARHIQTHEPGTDRSVYTIYTYIGTHIHTLIFLQTLTCRFSHLLTHAYS